MRPLRPSIAPAAAVVAAMLLGACSSDSGGSEDQAPTASPTATGSQAAPPSDASPSEEAGQADGSTPRSRAPTTPAAEPEPGGTLERRDPPPISLPAYFSENRAYAGRALRPGGVRGRTAAYTSYDASFRSDALRISGVINIPRGPGPFPAVVLAHGYIDPAYYTRGQGMTRERGVLASRGYIAFHVDYRAHGASDGSEQQAERRMRLGYVADVLNAASALRRSDQVPADGDRVALFGRSMGGGVTMRALAAAPDVFGAGVAWASVSSREDENFNRWTRDRRPEVARYVAREHGLPGTRRGREFWPTVSARPYLDRVTSPLMLVHGRFDSTCPPPWARASQRALQRAGADSRLVWYDDGHAFGAAFTAAMDRTIAFLDRRLA